jgi:hypothetical protein
MSTREGGQWSGKKAVGSGTCDWDMGFGLGAWVVGRTLERVV